jgi:hypothetical protein
MEWNRDKPAYNRATLEQVERVCANKNHTLIEYSFPNVTVKCHCGNVFTKTLRLYRPQKNGCLECDKARKSRKRPEHSLVMREKYGLTEYNSLKIDQLKRDFPAEVLAFMYSQKLTIKEISNLLGCGPQWVRNCLRSRGVTLRVKNDYRNPADDPRVRQEISKKCIERGAGGWKIKDEERHLPGTLYLVRYLDDSGTHFKLGITKRTLQERLGDKLISIIHLRHATLGECFDLEQSLLKWAKDNGHRYSSPTTTELIHPDGLPYLLDRLTALTSVA